MKLKLSDILLMAVAGFLDIYKTMRGSIYEQYRQNFYGYTSSQWPASHFQSLVGSAVRANYLRKVRENRSVNLQITPDGVNKLKRKWPALFYKQTVWDRKWRLVIFDIAEINRTRRNKLRRDLKHLGCGMIQKSVWISPHDILARVKTAIIDRNIKPNVILIETSSLAVDNLKAFACQIWPIIQINNEYERISQKLTREKLTKEKFRQIYRAFIDCCLKDPYLPAELLPMEWHYWKTMKLIKKLRLKYCKF